MSGCQALITNRKQRLIPLLEAARRIRDPSQPLGQRARRELLTSTRLSAEGIEIALEHCLEAHPSEAEISELLESVPEVPHAHVLLSANVFAAAHRAIALALAASERVTVRPSRREPVMARLLCEGSGQRFKLAEALMPKPGDHLWAYGTEATLAALRAALEPGVVLHAHGPGIGVAVLCLESGTPLEPLAAALAWDTVLFDQRGCLSPRSALVQGPDSVARAFAVRLARELAALELRVPRGMLLSDEQAEIARYRDGLCYAGEVWPAGSGWVSYSAGVEPLVIAPTGRNLHVSAVRDPSTTLRGLGSKLASVGFFGPETWTERLRRSVPNARFSPIGAMQSPRLDGPVDLRPADSPHRLPGSR